MKDGEIKKTGNSRFMRSLNMPDTYEGFKALLESGIFPFDLNGINPDGWKTIPDWLNKLNLLSNTTCDALGISRTSVPDDAFFVLSIGNNRALVEVTAYETNTHTPISNVLIKGIKTTDNEDVYTDSQGKASGFTKTRTTTISIDREYVDLNVSSKNVNTPFGTKVSVTVYATRLSSGNKTLTSSAYYKFTDRALVDIDLLGGGEQGEKSGEGMYGSSLAGDGGDGGKHYYKSNIRPNSNTRYHAIVGGANGGVSSFLGCSSSSGSPTGTGGTGASSFQGYIAEGKPGTDSNARLYGTGSIVGGGGGGGAMSNYSGGDGGSPYGGSGAIGTGDDDIKRASGKGYGGGGGGGYGGYSGSVGGDGYQGVIHFKWSY